MHDEKKLSCFELNYSDIGRRIQKRRLINSYTQRYLADIIGISLSHVSNIETGKTKPSLETLCKISRVFSCSVDELIFDDQVTLEYKRLKLFSQSDQFEIHVLENLILSIRENKKFLESDIKVGDIHEDSNM